MALTRETHPTMEVRSGTPTKKLTSDSISGDARHEGFNAGYALGKMERLEVDVEDFARALLHERAREMLGFARRLAARKGPAWEALIVWSGEDQ